MASAIPLTNNLSIPSNCFNLSQNSSLTKPNNFLSNRNLFTHEKSSIIPTMAPEQRDSSAPKLGSGICLVDNRDFISSTDIQNPYSYQNPSLINAKNFLVSNCQPSDLNNSYHLTYKTDRKIFSNLTTNFANEKYKENLKTAIFPNSDMKGLLV